MADAADRAQDFELADRERALEAQRLRRIEESHGSWNGNVELQCIDCEEPIEPERLRIVRVTSRCASCAREFEERMRHV